METERIADVTGEHLGPMTHQLDLNAFVAACERYRQANGGTEREAIDAIFGEGDFWPRVQEWAPAEAREADREPAWPPRDE